MTSTKKILATGACLLYVAWISISAQGTAMSDITKTLTDTTYIWAYEAVLKPGQKTDVHTHAAHFFYALTDIQLKVAYTDGKTEMFDVKAGDSGFSMSERPHSTENVGKQTARFLVVELKEHPYKEKMK